MISLICWQHAIETFAQCERENRVRPTISPRTSEIKRVRTSWLLVPCFEITMKSGTALFWGVEEANASRMASSRVFSHSIAKCMFRLPGFSWRQWPECRIFAPFLWDWNCRWQGWVPAEWLEVLADQSHLYWITLSFAEINSGTAPLCGSAHTLRTPRVRPIETSRKRSPLGFVNARSVALMSQGATVDLVSFVSFQLMPFMIQKNDFSAAAKRMSCSSNQWHCVLFQGEMRWLSFHLHFDTKEMAWPSKDYRCDTVSVIDTDWPHTEPRESLRKITPKAFFSVPINREARPQMSWSEWIRFLVVRGLSAEVDQNQYYLTRGKVKRKLNDGGKYQSLARNITGARLQPFSRVLHRKRSCSRERISHLDSRITFVCERNTFNILFSVLFHFLQKELWVISGWVCRTRYICLVLAHPGARFSLTRCCGNTEKFADILVWRRRWFCTTSQVVSELNSAMEKFNQKPHQKCGCAPQEYVNCCRKDFFLFVLFLWNVVEESKTAPIPEVIKQQQKGKKSGKHLTTKSTWPTNDRPCKFHL